VSGASHRRFGNVDWKVVWKIGVPGAIGAFAGATFLSGLSTETAAPLMSLILLVLGFYVLIRVTVRGLSKERLGQPLRKRFLAPLGLVGGFVDAAGGGGWGPVGTQDDRLDRHQRVPHRGRRKRRFHRRDRLGEHQLRLGRRARGHPLPRLCARLRHVGACSRDVDPRVPGRPPRHAARVRLSARPVASG
jgi:hypothetical protein